MQFLIPKFIEREPRVLGPLTFKQSLYIGVAGGISFVLYFAWGKKNPFFFIIITLFIMGIASSLAFLKIEGRPLPIVLANFFKFSLSKKLFLWEKKEYLPKLIAEKKIVKKQKPKEEISLKIDEQSKLKRIKSKIETGLR